MSEEIEASGGDSCVRCGAELYSDGVCPSCPAVDGDWEPTSHDLPLTEEPNESKHRTRRYGTCLFTDLVESTALTQRLGDSDGARLMARHNELFRRLLRQYDGQEQSYQGDGFFATFQRPSDSVRFALAFRDQVGKLNEAEALQIRFGIHVGGFHVVSSEDGGPSTVLGLAVNVAARVVDLARPLQILMTRNVFDEARQVSGRDGLDSDLRWISHGAFWLKGVDGPIEVCEVGREGSSPLQPPESSSKARRQFAGSREDAPGWRPAVGLEIPDRPGFVLRRKLGEGGFGEVWLADKSAGRERAFKFCVRPDRVRALRQEVRVFRWLKDRMGERADIASLLDWHLDEEPYFLESNYVKGGSLVEWAETQGGLSNIPLETRLEIARQAARAVQAAHTVGVLHKDVKPSNVLINTGLGDQIQVRIADFGLGEILRRERLSDGAESETAPSTGTSLPMSSTASGTAGYMAPEVRRGSTATTQSDVYSLGILLYQLVVADFKRLPDEGWDQDVHDPILREDIRSAIYGDPDNRIASAADLVRRIETIHDRRGEVEDARRRRSDDMAERRARARRKRQMAAALLVTGVAGAFLLLQQFFSARNELAHTNLAISRLVKGTFERQLQTAMTLAERGAHDGDVSSALRAMSEPRGGETDVSMNEVRNAPLQPQMQRAMKSTVGIGLDADWIVSAAAANRRGAMVGHLVKSDDKNLRPDPLVLGRNYSNRDWFHGNKQGGGAIDEASSGRVVQSLHISEPYVSSAKGSQPKLAISMPVPSTEQPTKAVGVFQVAVAIEHLSHWVKSAVRPDSDGGGIERDVVIVNGDGQIVLHPNPMAELTSSDSLRKEPPKWEDAAELSEGVTHEFLDPYQGRQHDVSVSKLQVADESFTILVRSPPPAASVTMWVALVAIFVAQLIWGTLLLLRAARGEKTSEGTSAHT